ncbi:MAG: hypothetical protein ACK4MF_05655 [Hyphomicrobiaceae bacterium]
MFRRLFYAVLLLVFAAPGLLSAWLLHARYLEWARCTDQYGRCFDATTGAQMLDTTGITLAYAAITFVLALLALWALGGMLRPRRRPVAA